MGKKGGKKASASSSSPTPNEEKEASKGAALTKTGAVANYSPPNYDENERNVKISRLDINYYGHHILQEANLELVQGRRYGLIGPNGCGKSTLMNVLGAGEIELPPKLDYCHLSHEVESTEESVLSCVMKVDTERQRLEQELEDIQEKEEEGEEDAARLDWIYERLDELEAETAEARASRILAGLGFDHDMQQRPCRSYSGGWRMRVALAQVLFMRPSMLLLDEPTNHLDIEAVVWLENYLSHFRGILLMVSHSQDFMNSVCTNIIHMHKGRLNYYSGNYDQYVITRAEKEEHQMKRFAWEQGQMKSMKDYIARFGHGSKKLARQAQSKEKTLAKMVRGGLTEMVAKDANVSFAFPDPGFLPPPVVKFEDVYFRYPTMDHDLYEEVNFALDLESHVCLVGPNGAGKTTLQKLITGELEPTKGFVTRNGHCVVARFNQHFVDQLDMDLTPLQYMRKEFPDVKEPEQMRSWLGRFGVTGSAQTSPIGTLSDGQKSRVVLSWMAQRGPHLLLLDEPTNHLDMDSIDALAEALNEFEGAVVLVSHDMRLIAQAASEIYICDNHRVTKFPGDIADYKQEIEQRVQAAEELYKKERKKGNHGSHAPQQAAKKATPAPRASSPPTAAPASSSSGGGAGGKKKKGGGGVSKSMSIGAKTPAPATPVLPPVGAEVKVQINKKLGEGLGIGLDADEGDDGNLLVLLGNVAEDGVADKHGLKPFIGCQIKDISGKIIDSQQAAVEAAVAAKNSTSVTITLKRRK